MSAFATRRWMRATVLVAAAGALTACSFAPPYEVPKTEPAPAEYAGVAQWKIAEPRDAAPKGQWWEAYGDPMLSSLESKVAGSNQTLAASLARLQQARDDTRIARAGLFPSLEADASFTRARASPYSPRFPAGAPTVGNDYDLEADFSYELDLWGRVRNQVSSARSSQQASAADTASMELSVRAELATDYFYLRNYDEQILLLDQTIQDYTQAAELTQNLFDGGAAALTDVAQSQLQLQGARTQATDARLQRTQTEHAVAVLVGENPSTFRVPVNPLTLDVAPPPIDPGIPTSLLERRPDVAQAERQVAAANADIGVARAAYFPQVNLVASAGWNSVNRSVFAEAASRFWQFGPQVSWPLFEGGRLVAQTDKMKAVRAERIANYRNTVLAAYQQVEDQLTALMRLDEASRSQASAVLAAEVALQQARIRYEEGQVTYLEVATSEASSLQARLSGIAIQGRRMEASVQLIKALGGGWQGL